MEFGMRMSLTVIAALTATGTAAFAEPPKAASPRPASEPVKIVLASADTVGTPGPVSTKSVAPAKRRIGRVTTCRCGDPLPESQTQEQ
jgi:hypothetical protein